MERFRSVGLGVGFSPGKKTSQQKTEYGKNGGVAVYPEVSRRTEREAS
jgi:hypothetical protein